jgi:hypothetical protein
MKKPIENEAIEQFVTRLFYPDRSTAARAYAAYFIKTYRDEIDVYIHSRINLTGSYDSRVWAKKVNKLLRRHQRGPKGYVFNPNKGTLDSLYSRPCRSFRLERDHRHSLTFIADHRIAVIAGYIVACAGVAVVLWMGWTAKVAIEALGDQWVLSMETFLYE